MEFVALSFFLVIMFLVYRSNTLVNKVIELNEANQIFIDGYNTLKELMETYDMRNLGAYKKNEDLYKFFEAIEIIMQEIQAVYGNAETETETPNS